MWFCGENIIDQQSPSHVGCAASIHFLTKISPVWTAGYSTMTHTCQDWLNYSTCAHRENRKLATNIVMTMVDLVCNSCSISFTRKLKDLKRSALHYYCSKRCKSVGQQTGQILTCSHCNKEVRKTPGNWKSVNAFCSRSCSATYNNLHRTKGCRRSKLETWLVDQLTNMHPKLSILSNDKTAINSELDIYLPSLNLAFELNGIFHYFPIHGDAKLKQIQENDSRKARLCVNAGINLTTIDVSGQKHFSPHSSLSFLDEIKRAIDAASRLVIDNHRS